VSTFVRKSPVLTGSYALANLASIDASPAQRIDCGIVRFGCNVRSPATGLHTNSRHEVAFVLKGKVLIETADARFEAGVGDCIVGSPAEPHATTGLEDSVLFFVLIEPTRAVASDTVTRCAFD
jgi:mannose-6-phosphate isomerase-like protein (cupin superfamily)